MAKKVAVVTGSNKGIGFAIVRGLCKRFEGDVFLTARDVKRGEEAIKTLKNEGLKALFHQLDITDNKSVEKFRDFLKTHYEGIDILINNAAIAFKYNATEPAYVQAEETLRVNYFGVLSSCEILFPLLKNGARVINISSSSGHLTNIPSEALREQFKDPKLTIDKLSELMNSYIDAVKEGRQVKEWGNNSYSVSKVGLTALTMIQQRMVLDRDIKVNAVHPGYVVTDMTTHTGDLTVDEGAQAPLYLALDAPDEIKGQYVWCDKKIVSWEYK